MYKQGDIVLILFKKFGQVNVNVLNRIRSLLQNLSAAM